MLNLVQDSAVVQAAGRAQKVNLVTLLSSTDFTDIYWQQLILLKHRGVAFSNVSLSLYWISPSSVTATPPIPAHRWGYCPDSKGSLAMSAFISLQGDANRPSHFYYQEKLQWLIFFCFQEVESQPGGSGRSRGTSGTSASRRTTGTSR